MSFESATTAKLAEETAPPVQANNINGLLERLKDADVAKREEATAQLVAMGQIAVTPLIIALKDENLLVRLQAAITLGRLNDKSAIEPLVSAFEDEDEDSEVCLAATVALARLGDDATLQYCLAGLEDEDSEERAGSAIALGLIGNTLAVEPLILRLADTSGSVRRYAAAALGELGDAKALPALQKLYQQTTALSQEGRRILEVAKRAIERLKSS